MKRLVLIEDGLYFAWPRASGGLDLVYFTRYPKKNSVDALGSAEKRPKQKRPRRTRPR